MNNLIVAALLVLTTSQNPCTEAAAIDALENGVKMPQGTSVDALAAVEDAECSFRVIGVATSGSFKSFFEGRVSYTPQNSWLVDPNVKLF